jgi:hypothetical protein
MANGQDERIPPAKVQGFDRFGPSGPELASALDADVAATARSTAPHAPEPIGWPSMALAARGAARGGATRRHSVLPTLAQRPLPSPTRGVPHANATLT